MQCQPAVHSWPDIPMLFFAALPLLHRLQVDFRDAASFDLLKSHACQGYQVESASYAPEKGK